MLDRLDTSQSPERLAADLIAGVQGSLRYDGLPPVSVDRIREMEGRVRQYMAKKRIARNHEAFAEAIGPRYVACSLTNFEAGRAEQKTALTAVKAFAEKVGEHVERGNGLLLFGPAGTGKDHLLCGAAREAIERGHWVRWVNGRDLFGQFRDRMDNGDSSEGRQVADLVAVEILAISDPLPPYGALSSYQADLLFRVIDARYRAMRPTWATLNVTGGTEADQRMGAQIVDRLRHDAVAIHCDWPSYRKAKA